MTKVSNQFNFVSKCSENWHAQIIVLLIHCKYMQQLLKKLKVVPLFIRLMAPNGAIWSLDQRTVIMR